MKKHIQAYGLWSPITEARKEQIAKYDLANVGFETAADVAAIKALNPNMIIVGYYDVMAVHQTLEGQPNPEFTFISTEHPDWFLRDKNGEPLVHKYWGWYALDVGNREWQRHYGERAKQMCDTYGFNGIHADDVWEWVVPWHNTVWTVDKSLVPPEYAETWNVRMLDFIRTVKAILGNKLVVLNTSPTYTDYVNSADGVKIEDFMLREYADLHIQGYLDVASRGKTVLCQFTGAAYEGAEDYHFGYCCFLLGATDRTYFAYHNIWHSSGGYVPIMDVDVGNPRGNYYQVQENLLGRDYDKAKVFVNFSDTETYNVTVDEKTYTLPPRSSVIVPWEAIPPKGQLQVRAYSNDTEVSASVEVVGVGTYTTPFSLELDPGIYELNAIYDTQEPSQTAEILDAQTTTVEFKFSIPPEPPPPQPPPETEPVTPIFPRVRERLYPIAPKPFDRFDEWRSKGLMVARVKRFKRRG